MQDFDQFLISTPEGLLVGGLYADQQLRVPLHEGEHRRASYALFVNWILREVSPERVGTVMSKISAVVPHYSDEQAAHGADADAPPEGGDLTDDFMMIGFSLFLSYLIIFVLLLTSSLPHFSGCGIF